MTVPKRDWRTNFQAHLASRSPHTQRVYLASVERLQAWARRDGLDPIAVQTADLERFFAEEVRSYATTTVQVRRAALRAFYDHLQEEGIVQANPASGLRLLASLDHLAALRGPVEYLTDDEISRLREHALRCGGVSSLAICMLHETPASVRQIARLGIADFARDGDTKPFAILGQTASTKTPWPISQQIVDAVEALCDDSARLISPHTRNPNIAMVRAKVAETRLSAGVQIPDLVGALKHAHHRQVRELCNHVRLSPRRLARYQRTLLPEMTPLDRRC